MESRSVEPFQAIELRGSGEIFVSVGSEPSIVVEIDDNLLELITTRVRKGRLVISNDKSFITGIGLTVTITLPKLEDVVILGSGNVQIWGLENEDFTVKIAGSGDVKAVGKSQSVKVRITGSGDADLSELAAKEADVKITGSGDALVNAKEKLRGAITGSGDIGFLGDPEVESHVVGSGEVQKVKDSK
ncbi:MAG: head GIN domain-containing protein [Planctomycetota bacterium]|jgi:hypothetical protein